MTFTMINDMTIDVDFKQLTPPWSVKMPVIL